MNIDNFYKYECNIKKYRIFYGLFIISLIIFIFYFTIFLLS